jgi:hypothetical protein
MPKSVNCERRKMPKGETENGEDGVVAVEVVGAEPSA